MASARLSVTATHSPAITFSTAPLGSTTNTASSSANLHLGTLGNSSATSTAGVASCNAYFVIVSPSAQGDAPIFEMDFVPSGSSGTGAKKGITGSATDDKDQDGNGGRNHLSQFIAYAALDCVEDVMMLGTSSTYLKVVDKFNDWFVSAYVLPSGIKFMLLHDTPNLDGIKNFFFEVHELIIKAILNPFYRKGAPLSGGTFGATPGTSVLEAKIRVIGKKYL